MNSLKECGPYNTLLGRKTACHQLHFPKWHRVPLGKMKLMTSQGIEDLLFATLDAISRFRVGQREAVNAALEAGGLLTEAKGRLYLSRS